MEKNTEKKRPVLVILAAGMGSRYGGLKQIDPIGPNGEIIIDFSLYDAWRAGFETVVCIIKHSIEDDFKRIMEAGAAKKLNVLYAYQELDDLPEGYSLPEGRTKPWGTGHAILAARELVDAPFAIINADDYYGPEAFKIIYDYLSSAEDGECYDFSMAGYLVENTLSENGAVTRGLCVKNEEGFLSEIHETQGIKRDPDGVVRFPKADGSFGEAPDGTLVSMNMFGFTPVIMKELAERFPKALDEILEENPMKGEFFIPEVVGEPVEEGKATVKVIPCGERWYGVTYQEDKPLVASAMAEKKAQGLYPEKLWK
ncbi:MAG: nucleotidyltransferase [Firmicutes bacterium]|nr:nucleotidyltransferase [Bacillota bacterium]